MGMFDNWFKRNKRMADGTSGESLNRNVNGGNAITGEQSVPLTENQLEGVQAGYSSENTDEREAFQAEQKEYVSALPKDNDELTEEQLEQVQTYNDTRVDGSRRDYVDEHIENQEEVVNSFGRR